MQILKSKRQLFNFLLGCTITCRITYFHRERLVYLRVQWFKSRLGLGVDIVRGGQSRQWHWRERRGFRCSRFLTTLAQFHSNRSRLIHGVQFNPLVASSSIRWEWREASWSSPCGPSLSLSLMLQHRGSCVHGNSPYTSIHYTYFKLSISWSKLFTKRTNGLGKGVWGSG